MDLSIIITHHKTPELLKLCINSLKPILGNSGFKYEVLVVDSQFQEETQDMMQGDFSWINYLPFKENPGYAKLVNKGIKSSSGEYILILNADVIFPEKGNLREIIGIFEKDPNIGIGAPQLLNFNGTWQPSCFRFYTPWTVLYRRTFLGKTLWGKKSIDTFLMKDALKADSWKPEAGLPVDWLMGSALFVRREAIKNVGLLDERFFMYFEDVDWCRRFWQNGYKVIYFPDLKLFHYHQRASKKGGGFLGMFLNKQTRIHIRSAIKYFLKYGFESNPSK